MCLDGQISVCMEIMDLGSFDHIYKKVYGFPLNFFTSGPIQEDICARIAVPCLKGLDCNAIIEGLMYRFIR